MHFCSKSLPARMATTRQYAPKVHPYTQLLEGGVGGLKIAVVKEGFGHAKSEPDVDKTVRDAAALLGKLGATITEVSIPWHLLGMSIFFPIATEGATQTMMWGDGYGVSRPDLYVTSLMDRHRGWRQSANNLSETVKLFTLFGTYIREFLRQPLLWQSHQPSEAVDCCV